MNRGTDDNRTNKIQYDAIVVDDSKFFRTVIAGYLSEHGFRVHTASCGAEALELARSRRPDVILLDVQMPDMDGFAVCEALKADPVTGRIPVIFVTGEEKTDQTVRGFEVGGADYVFKSSAEQEVVARTLAHARIARLQMELLKASRQAGMAEVASDVLHNVGNVLNSVNVSASVVADKLRKSRVSGLVNAAKLMREHADDLGTFVTQDEKGKNLPGYLAKLAEHLVAEQTSVLNELEGLTKNVEHINSIVSKQQSYAGTLGVIEPISIGDLLDDALKINSASLQRHGVRVVREYGEVPPVLADKHKVLRILVNLVRNAKHALYEREHNGRNLRLTLRIGARKDSRTQGHCGTGVSPVSSPAGRRCHSERVFIEVADDGVGIPRENMTRIFSHGFTTEKSGHGLGLHTSTLAAKEMGGSLTAHSDGPDKGATFTLELPIQPAEVSQ